MNIDKDDLTHMKEPILISITGLDRPGITETVMDVLSEYDASVLDIGQSVIHETLSLGMLVEIPAYVASPKQVKDALKMKIEALDLRIRFINVGLQEYANWVGQQGKARHIVTLLAKRITARQISRLAHVVVKNGLNIDKISRLSGRVPLESIGNDGQASVEFSLRGPVNDLNMLRRECLELANELKIDIAYQRDNLYRRHRRLVAFDMDSTLIQIEVIDELAKQAGVGQQVAHITERAMRGELDFNQSLKERVALLKGLPESVLAEVGKSLPLTMGAKHLIATLKILGYKTAIISGGFTYFGVLLQEILGIDYLHANQLELKNGQMTGRVVGKIIDGKRKASLLAEIAEKEGISLEQVIAVGDGANDLPMLSIAGLGIAFHAKPYVRESARQSIDALGLDSILYLMGIRERETH